MSASAPPGTNRLARLARVTGGLYASRHGQALDEAMDRLLAASSCPEITDVQVKAIGHSGDCNLSWHLPRPGEPVIVAGRWNGQETCTLRLTAKRDGEPMAVEKKITFPVQAAGPGPRRLWAHLRGAAMWRTLRQDADVKPEHLKALVDLSRTHRVVTPATAMLVLESDQECIRRGVRCSATAVPAGLTLAGSQAGLDKHRLQANELVVHDAGGRMRELCRLGQYEQAAAVAGDSWAGSMTFEARQQAALLREFVALRTAVREQRKRAKLAEAERAGTLPARPWHEWIAPPGPVGVVPLPPPADGAPAADAAASGWLDSPANEKLRRDLRRSVATVAFEEAKLADAMDSARRLLGANIVVDWAVLAKVGVGKGTPVSLRLSGVTGGKALKELLRAAGGVTPLGYGVEDGAITVSTKEDLAGHMLTRVYDIRDLLPYPPGPGEAPILSDPETTTSGGSELFGGSGGSGLFETSPDRSLHRGGVRGTWGDGGEVGGDLWQVDEEEGFVEAAHDDWRAAVAGWQDAAGDGSGDVGRRNDERIDEIHDIIWESVDRESGRNLFEDYEEDITHFMGTLVIKQTLDNHAKVADLLTQIRQTIRSAPLGPPAPAAATDTGLPEALFTRDGAITEWVERLLASAREGKLSAFSSVKLAEAGERKFARIGGVWFETSLTGRCRIHLIARGGGAKAALLKAHRSLEACFALGPIVIVRAGEGAAVSLDAFGITEADDKRLKALLEAITGEAGHSTIRSSTK